MEICGYKQERMPSYSRSGVLGASWTLHAEHIGEMIPGVEWKVTQMKLNRFILAAFVLAWTPAACVHAADLRYWIESCTRPETACKASDPELAEWALRAWERAAGGELTLERTDRIEQAHIRLRWADASQGQYGEARPFRTGTLQGAEVFVRPDLSAMGPDISAAAARDPLLRDAIVYLTCLHETGHALGLSHTADFPDIMYSFQFGGDIPEYFGRYRRLLKKREDIAEHPGMSGQDVARLKQALE